MIIENENGLIIHDDGIFYFLYNIENTNTFIIKIIEKFHNVKNMFLYDKQIIIVHKSKWGKNTFKYVSFFKEKMD